MTFCLEAYLPRFLSRHKPSPYNITACTATNLTETLDFIALHNVDPLWHCLVLDTHVKGIESDLESFEIDPLTAFHLLNSAQGTTIVAVLGIVEEQGNIVSRSWDRGETQQYRKTTWPSLQRKQLTPTPTKLQNPVHSWIKPLNHLFQS